MRSLRDDGKTQTPCSERVASREELQRGIEHDVRYANIAIIEGNQASQFGIGMVSARIAEMVLRDERAVIPIGSYNPDYGVTVSLPSIVGRSGVVHILKPQMSEEERQALARSAETLKYAVSRMQVGKGHVAARCTLKAWR